MEKKIVAIRYYNVWFYLHVNSEQDMVKISYLTDRIDAGEQMVMKDIYQWCQGHGIKYNSKFVSNEGISILENATRIGLPVPQKLKNVLEQLKEDDEEHRE